MAYVAGTTGLPLQNSPEVRLVFFDHLKYRGSDIGLENFFHLREKFFDQFLILCIVDDQNILTLRTVNFVRLNQPLQPHVGCFPSECFM